MTVWANNWMTNGIDKNSHGSKHSTLSLYNIKYAFASHDASLWSLTHAVNIVYVLVPASQTVSAHSSTLRPTHVSHSLADVCDLLYANAFARVCSIAHRVTLVIEQNRSLTYDKNLSSLRYDGTPNTAYLSWAWHSQSMGSSTNRNRKSSFSLLGK